MKIKEKIKQLKELTLDLLLPKLCLVCGAEGSYLCDHCFPKIPLIDKFSCPSCQKISLYGKTCETCQKSYYLNGVISALDYRNPLVSQMIKLLKYHFVKELIHPLAKILISEIKNSHFLSDNFTTDESSFLIIPIPLYHKKFLQRGFNQSELLAKKLAGEFDLNLRTDILFKIKSTKSQTDLKEKERHLNVKNTFEVVDGFYQPHRNHGFFQNLVFGQKLNSLKYTLLRSLSFGRVPLPHFSNNSHSEFTAEKNEKSVRDKIIFLIDDVLTTGSTLNEAAKVLKKAGAKEVWGMTLAKG